MEFEEKARQSFGQLHHGWHKDMGPREIHAYLVVEVIKYMNFRKDRTLFLHDGLLI